MTAERTLVVINPAAGSGRARQRWAAVRDEAARLFPFEEAFTEAPGHATTLAQHAVADGWQRILAVGGDGTLHELANGLANTRVALAALPCGTGNDFARSVGLAQPPRRLLQGLALGARRAVDLGQVQGRYYLNVAGVGVDAEVARLVNAMPRKGGGTVPYLLTAIREAFHYTCPELTIQVDDQPAQLPAPQLMVAVGNASAYGGGMRICPGAAVDDGLLDVLSVGNLRGWATLALLPKVFVGRHTGHPAVRYGRAATVRVTGPAEVALHADGELLAGLPATFTICPRALQLWVPAAPPA